MNNYVVLIWAARMAEGKQEEEKHNNSCSFKSGVVSDVPLGNEGNTNPDPEAPTWESWVKWVEMQQQLMVAVKGTQNALKPSQQGSNWGQRNNNQNTSKNGLRPQRHSGNWNNDTARSNQRQAGGNNQNQVQCYNCQGWGICDIRAPAPENTKPLTSPSTQTEYGTCTSASAKPQSISVITSPPYHNQDATIELIERVNETDIFVGDIWILLSLMLEHKFPPLPRTSVNNIHPIKQMLH